MPDGYLSDPHSVAAWSRYFSERRSTTRRRLEFMQGRGVAIEFAGRWQLHSSVWPASYWADFPQLVRIGPDCTFRLAHPPQPRDDCP